MKIQIVRFIFLLLPNVTTLAFRQPAVNKVSSSSRITQIHSYLDSLNDDKPPSSNAKGPLFPEYDQKSEQAKNSLFTDNPILGSTRFAGSQPSSAQQQPSSSFSTQPGSSFSPYPAIPTPTPTPLQPPPATPSKTNIAGSTISGTTSYGSTSGASPTSSRGTRSIFDADHLFQQQVGQPQVGQPVQQQQQQQTSSYSPFEATQRPTETQSASSSVAGFNDSQTTATNSNLNPVYQPRQEFNSPSNVGSSFSQGTTTSFSGTSSQTTATNEFSNPITNGARGTRVIAQGSPLPPPPSFETTSFPPPPQATASYYPPPPAVSGMSSYSSAANDLSQIAARLEAENRRNLQQIEALQAEKAKIESSLHAFEEAESISKNEKLNLEDANFDLRQSLRQLQQRLASAEDTIKSMRSNPSISSPIPTEPVASNQATMERKPFLPEDMKPKPQGTQYQQSSWNGGSFNMESTASSSSSPPPSSFTAPREGPTTQDQQNTRKKWNETFQRWDILPEEDAMKMPPKNTPRQTQTISNTEGTGFNRRENTSYQSFNQDKSGWSGSVNKSQTSVDAGWWEINKEDHRKRQGTGSFPKPNVNPASRRPFSQDMN